MQVNDDGTVEPFYEDTEDGGGGTPLPKDSSLIESWRGSAAGSVFREHGHGADFGMTHVARLRAIFPYFPREAFSGLAAPYQLQVLAELAVFVMHAAINRSAPGDLEGLLSPGSPATGNMGMNALPGGVGGPLPGEQLVWAPSGDHLGTRSADLSPPDHIRSGAFKVNPRNVQHAAGRGVVPPGRAPDAVLMQAPRGGARGALRSRTMSKHRTKLAGGGSLPRGKGHIDYEVSHAVPGVSMDDVGSDGFFEAHQKPLARTKAAPLPGIGKWSHHSTSKFQQTTEARVAQKRSNLESKLVHGELVSHNSWDVPQPPEMGRMKRGHQMSKPVKGAARSSGACTTR
jgi:hypothetical protein